MKLPRRNFLQLAAGAAAMRPAQLGKFIADETEKWGKVVKFANLKPD